jgi:hypothetical protein
MRCGCGVRLDTVLFFSRPVSGRALPLLGGLALLHECLKVLRHVRTGARRKSRRQAARQAARQAFASSLLAMRRAAHAVLLLCCGVVL